MQSLLAKLAAFAVLVGGFAVTGDLRRLADRGTRFVNATTVPAGAEQPAEPAPPLPPPPVAPPPAPSPPTVPTAQAVPTAPADTRDAPIGRPVDALRLPTSSLDTVDLGTLAPGKRLVVWVGSPPMAAAFDVVDPATGEVLEQSLAQPGTTPHAIPRRLRLEGNAARPRQVSRGTTLRLVPLGVAYGSRPAGPAETLGPVRAIEVR